MRAAVVILAAALALAPQVAQKPDKLDLNTATSAELSALPGMGREYARRVIAGRPYTAKNQLVTRGILPANEYGRITDFVIARHPKAPVEK